MNGTNKKIFDYKFWGILFPAVLSLNGITVAQNNQSPGDSGTASFYSAEFHGLETSNGEFFNEADFTAAHRTFPFNTILYVLNKMNGKTVIVRINDRGPFIKSRIIDLSHSAAKKIGMVPMGIVPIQLRMMTLLDNVPFNDSTFHESETWGCYGDTVSLSGNTIYIWSSPNWKHAFYMASQLSLDYKLDHVTVRVSGSLRHRYYQVLASGIDTKKECAQLIEKFKKEGFTKAGIYRIK